MVRSTPLVLVPKTLLRRFAALAIDRDNALCPNIEIRMDENAQQIRFAAENIVRAAPDDDAGLFFRQIRDDLKLHAPQIVGIVGTRPAMG